MNPWLNLAWYITKSNIPKQLKDKFKSKMRRQISCVFQINKLMSVFDASVLLLMINFVITLSIEGGCGFMRQ